MDIHILNGDALASQFPLDGRVIICRECLIDGPVNTDSLDDLWKKRAQFLGSTRNEQESYYKNVKGEFEKLLNIQPDSIINLWFEHDLFCQANLWFVVHYLVSNNINNPLFRVMPVRSDNNVWAGFGWMSKADLQNSYSQRVKFESNDIQLTKKLWNVYQRGDLKALLELSHQSSPCFLFLEEVCRAHTDRFMEKTLGRPQRRLKEILAEGSTDFQEVFRKFSATEGIYGFGDLQVKNMLSEL